MAATKKRTARKKAEPKRLTPMQRLFAMEYIVDLNATRAAIRAGFSEKSAAQQAHALMQNHLVLAEIDRLKAERMDRIKMDADKLLIRLFEEADADVADLFEDDGSLKPVKDWPPIWRKGLVAGIDSEALYEKDADGNKEVVGVIRKLKLSDRTKRLELIGRHTIVGAWKDKVEHDLTDPAKEFVQQISGRGIRPKEG